MPIIVVNGRTLSIGKVCSEAEQENFVHLCQEFNDIFTWTYDDLKGFDPSLFQHTIDLSDNAKPIRQKQRPINPKIDLLMKRMM